MNEKITLQDLVELFSVKHGITKKQADTIVRGMFDVIEEALSTEKYVKIKGLGTFKLTEVDSRESMNVNTGERIEIQGHTKISFTPDTIMKELINKPFSHFETVVLNEGVLLEDTLFEEEAKLEEVADEMLVEQAEAVASTEMVEPEEAPVTEPIAEEVEEPVEEAPVTEPIAEEVEESVEEAPATEPIAEAVEEPVEEAPATEPIIEAVEEPVEEAPVTEPIAEEVEEPVEEAPVTEPIAEAVEEPVEEAPATEPIAEEVEEPVEEALVTESIVEAVEEPQQEQLVESHHQNSNTILKVLVGIIIVLVLIILFGLYWMFLRSDEVKKSEVEPLPVQESIIHQEMEETEIGEDTIQIIQDTLVAAQPVVQEQTSVLSEDVVYEISGTITTLTLEPGQTLVKLALKYYGSKNFWPYIMEHNPNVIKDADLVPIGATIKIPKLEPKKKL